MILAAIFILFSLIAIIRLIAYANFTAGEKNTAGVVMLWMFTVIIFVCVVLAVMRL